MAVFVPGLLIGKFVASACVVSQSLVEEDHGRVSRRTHEAFLFGMRDVVLTITLLFAMEKFRFDAGFIGLLIAKKVFLPIDTNLQH